MPLNLQERWSIGGVEVPTRIVLAPMAGVSIQAFRRQGRRFGAGLVCSEMVSAAGIEHLSTVKRREVADRIRVAREFGDIAENAEYDDAKNEQAMLEHRIALLEERLFNARVISEQEISNEVVSIGSKVRVKNMDAGKTFEYHIVGSAEANPAENKLSNESPVGKAIIGHKKGDVVEVSAPRGALKFKILEIKAA